MTPPWIHLSLRDIPETPVIRAWLDEAAERMQAIIRQQEHDLVVFGQAGIVVPGNGDLPRNLSHEELASALARDRARGLLNLRHALASDESPVYGCSPSQIIFDEAVTSSDASTGAYLCETCFDAMTDLVLPAAHTATGQEEACCAGCWPPGVPCG